MRLGDSRRARCSAPYMGEKHKSTNKRVCATKTGVTLSRGQVGILKRK